MGYDQVGNAETLSVMQVQIDPVAEQGVDDAAAIPDRDQSGALARGTAVPPGETPPFVEGDAGIVQANQRVGRGGALPTHWNCLELFGRVSTHRLRLR